MFVKTVIRQGEKIHDLETDLSIEKEISSELRNENLDLKLEVRHLQEFKNKVINIITDKGTIVDKYDKVKELVDNLQTEN